jgi:hypothetical protein
MSRGFFLFRQVQVTLFEFPPACSAGGDFLAAFPVQALDDSSIDRPSRNSASAVSPTHFRSLEGAEAAHSHFHSHGCFSVADFPAPTIRATTLLSDSNKVISMCRDRDHRDSNVLFPRRFKVLSLKKAPSRGPRTNRPRFESQSARRRNVSTILRQPSVEFKLGCLAISPVD